MIRLLILLFLIGFGLGCKKQPQAVLGAKDVGELANVLREGKPQERPAAALELSKRGPDAFKALPALVEALQSDNPALRQNAALALGKIGPLASVAVDPLIKVLSDPEWTVRRSAVIALGEIGDPISLPAVQGLSRNPDSLVRKAAEQSAARLKAK